MTRSGLSNTPVPPIPPPLYDENEPLTERETELDHDPRVPLILGRPFLRRTGLNDVHGEERSLKGGLKE
ncbi:hypothetical protein Tco_0847163 [Tanacetum coccineum]